MSVDTACCTVFMADERMNILGPAILGAVAAGVYGNTETAANNMVTIETTIEQDQKRHEEYSFYYNKYIEVHELAKGWTHSLTMHI